MLCLVQSFVEECTKVSRLVVQARVEPGDTELRQGDYIIS